MERRYQNLYIKFVKRQSQSAQRPALEAACSAAQLPPSACGMNDKAAVRQAQEAGGCEQPRFACKSGKGQGGACSPAPVLLQDSSTPPVPPVTSPPLSSASDSSVPVQACLSVQKPQQASSLNDAGLAARFHMVAWQSVLKLQAVDPVTLARLKHVQQCMQRRTPKYKSNFVHHKVKLPLHRDKHA
jgi:hypothetical protein